MKEEIIKKLKTKQEELKRLPVACTGDWEKQAVFKDCVNLFHKEYENLTNGKYNQFR